ncbi:MAG TPA: adenylate cyclase regulatory domain-containing protein, partial [Caldimonas sp.]
MPRPSETIDYAAEGLFDDVETSALDARRRLLDYLLDEECVPLDEVKLAAKERRLMMLPVERALGGEPVYEAAEVAKLADFELELFLNLRRGLGLAEPALDQKAFSEYDVKVMRSVRANLEMGMSLEGIREINRVLASALSQLAATVERQFLTSFLQPGDDEYDIAVRYAEVARITSPEFGFVLQHLFNLHLREATRVDVLGNLATMDLSSDTRELAVCFADLVGFTSLGEQIRADELGSIAERLNEITIDLVQPPVRLIKTIGDAVMLASPESDALIDTALALIEAVDREEEGFPQLSAGLAVGEVLARGGDVYGPPVNHASRLCDVARPGSLVTTGELHERFEGAYDWTSVGRRRFKGIEQPIEIYRARAKGGREREKAAAKAREQVEQEQKRAERERERAIAAAEKDSEKAAKEQDKLAKGLERELQKAVEEREKEAAKQLEKAAKEAEPAATPIASAREQIKAVIPTEQLRLPAKAAAEQLRAVMPKKAKADAGPEKPKTKKTTAKAERAAKSKKAATPKSKKPPKEQIKAVKAAIPKLGTKDVQKSADDADKSAKKSKLAKSKA